MRLKTAVKALVVAAVLFTGVQFARVYIRALQLKKVLSDQALRARQDDDEEDEILRNVEHHIQYESVGIANAEDMEFTVEGALEPREDLIITAFYKDPVNLLVHTVVMDMEIKGVAEAPNR